MPKDFPKKLSKRKDERNKGQDIFLASKNEGLRDVSMAGKKIDNTREKKDSSKEESPIPMLILIVLILLGGILLAGFVIFSE